MNTGNTCYLNSVSQLLIHGVALLKGEWETQHDIRPSKSICIGYCLMLLSSPYIVAPKISSSACNYLEAFFVQYILTTAFSIE